MKGFIEEEWVRQVRDEAEVKWPRARDAWEAITWIIMHDEACGLPLNEAGNIRGYVFDGAKSAHLPSVEVIYEIQTNEVVVRDARFYEAPYTQHGRA
jgi:hypothetical protein